MSLYSVLDPLPVAFLILLSLLLSPNAGIYHILHLFICNITKATDAGFDWLRFVSQTCGVCMYVHIM